ncbi:hypothetical protein DAPPUDRAFT_238594 [Daphnia pulex]|uniref:Uncharacterized protein n=1 Tax=Daphnia pulex TaxID=6669 RepID=E9G6V7_DAPPU|nr:hypothetical protein DAPPUDRAFT_238594 [Daphnia pulex]|eukprot:EFX84354.1 hypothetical protein DAPPUDRAFT_238594 [Daphnia pulex]
MDCPSFLVQFEVLLMVLSGVQWFCCDSVETCPKMDDQLLISPVESKSIFIALRVVRDRCRSMKVSMNSSHVGFRVFCGDKAPDVGNILVQDLVTMSRRKFMQSLCSLSPVQAVAILNYAAVLEVADPEVEMLV